MKQIGLKRGNNPLRNEDGLSVMDMLMYLTLAALMVGGIFGAVTMAKSGVDIKRARDNVAMLNENVQRLYSAQDDYTGLTNAICLSAGVFPRIMVKGGAAFNVWNGAVTIAPVAGANPRTFTITYAAVPDEEAVQLATFNVGEWTSVTLNGTAITQVGGNPVSDASGAVLAGPNNTIIFESLR